MSKRIATGAILLFLLLFGPFIGKPFHIDDVAFINMSHMIGWNPLHAIPCDYPYAGRILPQLLPYEITHPLFVPYVIKLVRAACGESEVALHLAFLGFPAIALGAAAWLARLLGLSGRSRATCLVLLATLPAFMVNAHNVMTDVPALAFSLLGIAAFVHAVKHDSDRFAYLAAAALTTALFTSYRALFYLPVLALYALVARRVTRHRVVALLLPALLLLVWFLLVYRAYDIFPVLKTRLDASGPSLKGEILRGLRPAMLPGKLVAGLAILGSAMLFALPLHWFKLGRRGAWTAAGSAVAIGVSTPIARTLTGYTWGQAVTLSILVLLGATGLITALREAFADRETRPDGILLATWAMGFLLVNLLILPFAAARYMLPVLVPLLLLVTRASTADSLLQSRIAPAIACLLAIVLGLTAALADQQHARTYRIFADEVATQRAAGNVGDVWYIGEWGMRYYLEQAGARYLLANSTEPRPGDLIVHAEMPKLWDPSPDLAHRVRFGARREFPSRNPVKLFSKRAQAGFYAHHWGLLPMAFSFGPDEVFSVYHVYQ